MHCVFPGCEYEVNCTSSQEITFHSFPKEKSLCTAWLEVLGKKDWKPHVESSICSKHFLAEDFLETRTGCKLRSDAIPVVKLEVCRVCFARDCKLYNMKNDMHLDKAYETLTGFSIEHEYRLPPYLCIKCTNRLLNCINFRAKSIQAYSVLLEIHNDLGYITLDSILTAQTKLGSFNSDITWHQTKAENTNIKDIHADKDNIELEDLKVETDEMINQNILITDIRSIKGLLASSTDLRNESDNALDRDVKKRNEDMTNKSILNFELTNDSIIGISRQHLDSNKHVSAENTNLPVHHKVNELVSELINEIMNDDEDHRNTTTGEDCTSKESPASKKAIQNLDLNVTRETKNLKYSKIDKIWNRTDNDGLLLSYKFLSCDICTYQTVSKVHLIHHLRSHTKAKSYNCTKIPFFTNSKIRLQFHFGIHANEIYYVCDICKKVFNSKNYLITHLRKHSGEKPYFCNICDKEFNQTNQIKAHIRIHSGEKPYSCSVYNKAFRQKGQQQNHIRLHTGEKPYSCATCSRAFTQRGQLQNHLRIHTGEKPYSCNVCHKAFIQKGLLQKHVLKHVKKKH